MHFEKEQWIASRAYSLWEEDGCPDGRGHEHWRIAVAEYDLLEATRASVDGAEVLLRIMRKTSSSRTTSCKSVERPKIQRIA